METNTTTPTAADNQPIATKKCSHCGETKPITEFNKNSKTKDGLKSWCRQCSSEYNALRYSKSKPQVAPPQAVAAPHPIYSKMSPREIQVEIRDRINYLRSEGWECDVKLRYVQVREIAL